MENKNTSPLLTPQVFLERLAERLNDAKFKGAPKRKVRHTKRKDLESILNDEINLINQIYSALVKRSRTFSDSTQGQRHMTDVMISISFSIFATTCLQVMTTNEIDPEEFTRMLKVNLNKLFEDCGSSLIVKTKGEV